MCSRLRFFIFLYVLIAPLTACNEKTGDTTQKGMQLKAAHIVFIPKVTGNAFFESANQGVQAYAARHKLTVDYMGNPQATNEAQGEVIRKAIAARPDAVCISSLDATAFDSLLRQALAAGIKVVTWDSDVSGDARLLMVSQGTPGQLGRMLVEMGAKSLASRAVHPSRDTVRYVWHYSRPSVADQNSWQMAGEKYIRANYPNWVNVAPDNYYSAQDPQKAVDVGLEILHRHPDIDLIICNDSTALPGQAQAVRLLGKNARTVSLTGFASPKSMREYCKEGIIERWGLWDCKIQGSLAVYLAAYLASGGRVQVGDRIDVPEIGPVEVMPNTVLEPKAQNQPWSGVILLPQRLEFTAENVDKYDF